MSPAVSVMMPVYNAARYLAEAVESVLAQSFDDLELVVIDDGSTDRSLRILRRFEARDPRVRLASRENRGLVATRNELLAMAQGEFVAVLDADDVALPDRLAVQVAYLRDHPDIICIGTQIHVIDEAGRILHDDHPAMDHETIQERALSGNCPLANSSVMMRRDAVVAVGGYREGMQPAEDHDLFLRLGERGRLADLPDILAKYRHHSNSVSEKLQHVQLERQKLASDQACDRRGLARRSISQKPWRPTDRASRFDETLRCGWSGFNRGDREMGRAYGMKAIRLMPWRIEGWWLLRTALMPAPKEVEV